MKYERLTIKRENGFTTVRNTTLQGLIDRLAELEDKIESGTLVEVPQGAVVLTPEERTEEIRLCNEERKQAVKEFAVCMQEAFYADWQHGDISEEIYKFIIGEILFVMDEGGYEE